MDRETELALLDRIADSGRELKGLMGPASMVNPARAYTCPDRFRSEVVALFRRRPVLFALSGELAAPGSWMAADIGGVPVVAVRQKDGSLSAFVNACRHRGAPLVQGSGDGLTAFACPYHGWTYRLDGTLVARPASAGAFDDVTLDCALHRVAIAERHGLVFVRAEGDGPIDIDDTLGGLADDLAGYELARYVPVETRTNRWAVNWKMIIDTFMEQYHIRWLHRNSIAPSFLSYSTLFDAFGANGRIIGLQRDVMQEIEKPRDERRLIPCSTIQYNLVPRALLVHQIDHLELWRINPLGVASTETVTSVFAPESPPTEKARNYFIKNLDLLLRVTGSEDFPMMERIQHALQSQRLPEVVYGRIEPGLVHFHKSVNALLEEAAAS